MFAVTAHSKDIIKFLLENPDIPMLNYFREADWANKHKQILGEE